MSQTQVEKPWDFSQIYSLIDSLSKKDDERQPSPVLPPYTRSVTSPKVETQKERDNGLANGLGDFSSIWQYLGKPPNPPAPKLEALDQESPPDLNGHSGILEYTSDGAVYPRQSSKPAKRVQWSDDEVTDDAAPGASDDGVPQSGKLSKKQRQKRNKKERQRLQVLEQTRKAASDVESEAEIHSRPRTPARKASAHSLREQAIPTPTPAAGKEELKKQETTAPSVPVQTEEKPKAPPITSQKKEESKAPSAPSNAAASISSAREAVQKAMERGSEKSAVAVPPSSTTKVPEAEHQKKTPSSKISDSSRITRQQSEPAVKPMSTPVSKEQKQDWPVSKPYDAKASRMLPASVRPARQSTASPQQAPSSQTPDPQISKPEVEQQQQLHVPTTPSRTSANNKTSITPLVLRSGEDRHWAFLLKLISNFYSDRGSLIRPANLTTHSSSPTGIHVFVDASNIFIGFHDQLKRARGIPPHVRVPRVDMSFDALALLMERRRPVAKRVLAGSTPTVAAFDVARSVGYETAILDKVYKARELTDRQVFFMQQDEKAAKRRAEKRRGGNNGGGAESSANDGYSSSADDDTDGSIKKEKEKVFGPEKYVEQGVDEILHLKILETLVDYSEPSTIVLATGDAAQAEYSEGFMKMVERALKKGWSVELVSWSMNISGMYKREKFRRKWGERFKIVYLDDYAEELLDM